MTAKILILTSKNASYNGNNWEERKSFIEEFTSQLQDSMDDSHIIYTTYDELMFTVTNQLTEVRDLKNDISLGEVDLVHFKNWEYDQGLAAVVSWYLASQHIPFYNSEVKDVPATGKLAQMFKLAQTGLPIPATYALSIPALKAMVNSKALPTGLSYPLVFKADNGSKGNDNYLVKNQEEFVSVLTSINDTDNFIMQEFVPNEGDYRYLFMGLDEDPLVFLRRGSGDTHLNNTSQGGAGTFQPITGLVQENLSMARQAARVLGKQIGGVDIIVDKDTHRSYLLEVNGTPAIATGFGKEEKLSKLAALFSQQLEAVQEEE